MPTKKVIWLRHAHAVPEVKTGQPWLDDKIRTLSEEGLVQAQARHESFQLLRIARVICSIAERTLRTGEIVCKADRTHFTIVPQLFTPKRDAAIFNEMYAELGNAPAAAYLRHRLNSDQILERFAATGAQTLHPLLFGNDDSEIILIPGHGSYMQLIAAQFAMNRDPTFEKRRQLYDIVLQPTGYFVTEFIMTEPHRRDEFNIVATAGTTG